MLYHNSLLQIHHRWRAAMLSVGWHLPFIDNLLWKWADYDNNVKKKNSIRFRKISVNKCPRFLGEAQPQHLHLHRDDRALGGALHLWLIYRPILPMVPIKRWLDWSLMMVQAAAAMSTVSLSTGDWLQEATLTQINLCKWHKGYRVFIFPI